MIHPRPKLPNRPPPPRWLGRYPDAERDIEREQWEQCTQVLSDALGLAPVRCPYEWLAGVVDEIWGEP